jgi:preprotein translocase subunit SecG
MDNVTIIRIVAVVFCVVIAFILIQRRRTRDR